MRRPGYLGDFKPFGKINPAMMAAMRGSSFGRKRHGLLRTMDRQRGIAIAALNACKKKGIPPSQCEAAKKIGGVHYKLALKLEQKEAAKKAAEKKQENIEQKAGEAEQLKLDLEAQKIIQAKMAQKIQHLQQPKGFFARLFSIFG